MSKPETSAHTKLLALQMGERPRAARGQPLEVGTDKATSSSGACTRNSVQRDPLQTSDNYNCEIISVLF